MPQNICFGANIFLVSNAQFYRQFPHLRPLKDKLVSYPYTTEEGVTVSRKKKPHLQQIPQAKRRAGAQDAKDNLRFTDPVYDCSFTAVGKGSQQDVFHLNPKKRENLQPQNLNRLSANIPPLKSKGVQPELTLIGGDAESDESKLMRRTIINQIGTSHNIPTREMWGAMPEEHLGLKVYVTKRGHYWCTPANPKADQKLQKKSAAKQISNWYSIIKLLSGDKLFVGDTSKPALAGPIHIVKGQKIDWPLAYSI